MTNEMRLLRNYKDDLESAIATEKRKRDKYDNWTPGYRVHNIRYQAFQEALWMLVEGAPELDVPTMDEIEESLKKDK